MSDLEQAMTALVEYGYTHEEDDSLVRYKGGFPRDKWAPEGDGFLRYTREDGQWAPVPYTIHADWAGVSGLDHRKQPQCFTWLYPADYVLNIYATALQAADE